jgi:hypothetical protein
VQNELRHKRLAGLAGIAGALLFFSGDMLLNGHWGSGGNFREGAVRMLHECSQMRLLVGGLLGPVAGCLCILGFWHVRQNLVGRSPMLGRVVFFALAATMVAVSAVHALVAPLALARRYSDAHGGTGQELLEALRNYYGLTYGIAKGPAYLGAILLLLLVVMGKSSYPRWTALANFGPLLLLEPLTYRVPAPLGAPLVGGFESLCLTLFFLVSVLSTWRSPAGQPPPG